MKKYSKWSIIIATILLGASLAIAKPVKADSTESSQSSSVVNQSSNNSQSNKNNTQTKKHFNRRDYLKRKPELVRLKHETTLYRDSDLTKKDHEIHRGRHLLISALIDSNDQKEPVLRTKDGDYLSAKKDLVEPEKPYQNPRRYHQVHYTQIKPYGKVGYDLYRGYEGIKTWKVMHRLHTWSGRNY